MIDLDDLDAYAGADPTDYLSVVEQFADQMREALQIARRVGTLPSVDGIESIAVLGMGGSGISGDVAKTVLGPELSVYMETVKGYWIPPWVGENTLVFAVSYSGNTEETLEALRSAAARGARLVGITTGGKVRDLADTEGFPVVVVPPGLQPRAALGYVSVPILVLCEAMGLATGITEQIEEAIERSEHISSEMNRKVAVDANPSKAIANDLLGKIPLVYGSEGLSSVAAYRWKCQLNECSKVPAWWATFSELNHNEIVGWNRLADLTRQFTSLVILRHEGEHPQNSRRIEITRPLIEGNISSVHEVKSSAESAFARFVDLAYTGDFVSAYLAIAQGVDPAPVEVIESLKSRLS